MILGKRGQVVVAAPDDPDQGDLVGIDLLQFLTMFDGDQPVFGAMNDVRMAVHTADPFIGAQVIPQYPSYRKYGQEPFHHYAKIIIRGVQDKIAGFVI